MRSTPVNCTRKQIKQAGGLYSGTCADKHLTMAEQAIRLRLPNPVFCFTDALFGDVQSDRAFCAEDFIVKRRDGLFAYQLVVVVDDIDQGINQVVRGADILELTTRQLGLYQLFNVAPPSYLHLPLAVTEPGFKLSKQNHAQGINIQDPKPELIKALKFLGLPCDRDLASGSVADIINWAIQHWDIKRIPMQNEILI